MEHPLLIKTLVHWNVSNVADMDGMFNNSDLSTIIMIQYLLVGQVKTYNKMFH